MPLPPSIKPLRYCLLRAWRMTGPSDATFCRVAGFCSVACNNEQKRKNNSKSARGK